MAAFLHWVAVSFNGSSAEEEVVISDSFIRASGLKASFQNATGRILTDYHAKSGRKLTSAGSCLLRLKSPNKMLIVVCGKDCESIQNWQSVHDFLSHLNAAKICRVDIASDFKNLSLSDIDAAYTNNQFFTKGTKPAIWHVGQFVTDDGAPRTINIGKRSNGKCLRAYEIGRKLPLINKNIIRLEVELRGVGRVIPFDVLRDPHSYFCGTYPFLKQFQNDGTKRIATVDKVALANYAALIEHLKISYGKVLNLMREIETSDTTILDLLVRPGFPQNVSFQDIEALKKLKSQPELQPESMELKVLRLLEKIQLSKSLISQALGQRVISGQLNKVIRKLIKNQSVAYTVPSKPNSCLQQYKITETGQFSWRATPPNLAIARSRDV
jgi:Replication initiation factor